jgi:broad specificity phosphatase PhoE
MSCVSPAQKVYLICLRNEDPNSGLQERVFLSEAEKKWAEDLGGRLKSLSIGDDNCIVITSNSPKAIKATEIATYALAYRRTIPEDPRLSPVNLGRLSGLSQEELLKHTDYKRYQGFIESGKYFIPMDQEKGESLATAAKRAFEAIRACLQAHPTHHIVAFVSDDIRLSLQMHLTKDYALISEFGGVSSSDYHGLMIDDFLAGVPRISNLTLEIQPRTEGEAL